MFCSFFYTHIWNEKMQFIFTFYYSLCIASMSHIPLLFKTKTKIKNELVVGGMILRNKCIWPILYVRVNEIGVFQSKSHSGLNGSYNTCELRIVGHKSYIYFTPNNMSALCGWGWICGASGCCGLAIEQWALSYSYHVILFVLY